MAGIWARNAGAARKLRAAFLAVFVVGVVWSCLDPTETTVELTTDVNCQQHGPRTAIYAGSPGTIDPTAPVTITAQCNSDGSVGTIVVVPQTKDAKFEVEIFMALDNTDPTQCLAKPSKCIVARRRLSSIPHTPLVLPIDLSLLCVGVVCDPASTCYKGTCVSSDIGDPSRCATPTGCPLVSDGGLPDGTVGDGSSGDGTGPDTMPPLDAGDGASPVDATTDTSPPVDATMDTNPPVDAPADTNPPVDAPADTNPPIDADMPDTNPPIDADMPDTNPPGDASPPIDSSFPDTGPPDSGGPPDSSFPDAPNLPDGGGADACFPDTGICIGEPDPP